MVRRIVTVLVLLIVGFLLYTNRHHIAYIAGLESNTVRIQGEWYALVDNFKDPDIYVFTDGIIFRNDDTYGSYYFTSYTELVVTTGPSPVTYTVQFPDEDTMEWSREIKGKQTVVERWAR